VYLEPSELKSAPLNRLPSALPKRARAHKHSNRMRRAQASSDAGLNGGSDAFTPELSYTHQVAGDSNSGDSNSPLASISEEPANLSSSSKFNRCFVRRKAPCSRNILSIILMRQPRLPVLFLVIHNCQRHPQPIRLTHASSLPPPLNTCGQVQSEKCFCESISKQPLLRKWVLLHWVGCFVTSR